MQKRKGRIQQGVHESWVAGVLAVQTFPNFHAMLAKLKETYDVYRSLVKFVPYPSLYLDRDNFCMGH